MPRKAKDITGQRFGRLVVIKRTTKHGVLYWSCLCDCGKETIAKYNHLRVGSIRSCGFLAQENRTKHGKHDSPEYRTWNAMIRRCTDKNNKNYGGRGIIICQGMRDFSIFCKVMGKRPKGYQLDRENNNASYTCGSCDECLENDWPMNCRWVTPKQNSRNTRTNRHLTYKGETHTLAGWAEIFGLNHNTLCTRLRQGWPVEKALTAPIKHY